MGATPCLHFSRTNLPEVHNIATMPRGPTKQHAVKEARQDPSTLRVDEQGMNVKLRMLRTGHLRLTLSICCNNASNEPWILISELQPRLLRIFLLLLFFFLRNAPFPRHMTGKRNALPFVLSPNRRLTSRDFTIATMNLFISNLIGFHRLDHLSLTLVNA